MKFNNTLLIASAIILPALTSSCSSGSAEKLETFDDSLSYAYAEMQALNLWDREVISLPRDQVLDAAARQAIADAVEAVLLSDAEAEISDSKILGIAAGKDIARNLDFFQSAGIGVNRKLFVQNYSDVFSSRQLPDSSEMLYRQGIYDNMMSRFNNIILRHLRQNRRQREADNRRVALKNEQAARDFVAQLQSSDPAIEWLDSGIGIKTVTPGTGTLVRPNQNIEVIFAMTSIDGADLGSSEGQPIEVNPSEVIDGLRLAFLQMSPSGTYRVYIPSKMAYGRQGADGIAPGQMLIFDIQLINAL